MAILIVTIGLALGVFGLLARYLCEDYEEWKRRKESRTTLIHFLFAEIDYNVREMELSGANLPDLDEIQDKLAQKDYRLNIGFAPRTFVYRSSLQNLHYLDDSTMQLVINLYGGYGYIVSQCEGLSISSFKTLDAENQLSVIRRIYETRERCLMIGKTALANLEAQHKELGLIRLEDRDMQSHDVEG